MKKILVIGGARSGKSRFAEQLVKKSGKTPFYIATATAEDEEMRQRIKLHRQRRGMHWKTKDAPVELVETIERVCAENSGGAGAIILVDCLTLWLSGLMLNGHDVQAAGRRLCFMLVSLPCDIVLVANEVGFGIVPDNALARRFRDEAGRLNQDVATCVETVYLVAAGLPLCLKGQVE